MTILTMMVMITMMLLPMWDGGDINVDDCDNRCLDDENGDDNLSANTFIRACACVCLCVYIHVYLSCICVMTSTLRCTVNPSNCTCDLVSTY